MQTFIAKVKYKKFKQNMNKINFLNTINLFDIWRTSIIRRTYDDMVFKTDNYDHNCYNLFRGLNILI